MTKFLKLALAAGLIAGSVSTGVLAENAGTASFEGGDHSRQAVSQSEISTVSSESGHVAQGYLPNDWR